MKKLLPLLFAAVLLTGCAQEPQSTTETTLTPTHQSSLPLEEITLPTGFHIDTFAENLTGARSMALAEDGTLFVGTRDHGNVYALKDTNGDHKADTTYTIATGLQMPNGVAYKDNTLYVAETHRIIAFQNILDTLEAPSYTQVYNGLPKDYVHGWKYLAIGPDDKLYFGIGAPCNTCVSENNVYSSISRVNRDGSAFEIFAKVVRNTVGFDWNPLTKELWFTDNGRDLLGDNLPPDELNNAPQKGLHFGFPFMHGQNIEDPDLYSQIPENLTTTPPVQELGPHVAALGMKFYEGAQFPASYQNSILIAEHGSWNRSEPIGYRVSQVTFDNVGASSYQTFAKGWLRADGTSWGRPVDILEMPDGSILVSDDKANAIYRISYKK